MRGSLGRPLRRKSRRPRRESKAWPLDDYGPLDLPSDIAVCRLALSFMTAWGVDADFDARCAAEIGVSPPAPVLAYGVCGHGGRLSFLTPHAQRRDRRWQCSPHMTALWSLGAVSLANTLMMCPGYDEVRNTCSSVVTHFSVTVPEAMPQLAPPSLSFLARHYCDPTEEVQAAARALLEGALQRMTPQMRQRVVEAWRPRLVPPPHRPPQPTPPKAAAAPAPSVAPSHGQLLTTTTTELHAAQPPATATASPAVKPLPFELTSAHGVAVLVLGVLVCRFGAEVDPAIHAALTSSLLALLDSPSEAGRLAAADLLSKAPLPHPSPNPDPYPHIDPRPDDLSLTSSPRRTSSGARISRSPQR